METDLAQLDPSRQETAREYARIRRRLFAVQLVLGGLYLVLWIAAGWYLLARDALLGLALGSGLAWWALVLVMALAVGLPYFLLTLPLDYYSGFTLPHRYGMSNQDRRGWLTDLIKGLIVSGVIGAPLLIGLYGLMRAQPDTWWFWAASLYTLVTAVLTAVAPVLLMPLFFKFQPLGEEYDDLKQRLLDLAQRADTHVRGVFKFDMSRRTKAANAALAGLGRTRRIILGDTLLDKFTTDEIETILAHELGHHVHRDIPLSLLFTAVANFLSFYLAFLVLNALAAPLGLLGASDPAGLPLLMLTFGVFGFVTLPLRNGLSRWRENRADTYALEMTGKPEAFASAMTRLANQNLADVDPEPWVVFLLHSHPPLRDRIARAEQMEAPPATAAST